MFLHVIMAPVKKWQIHKLSLQRKEAIQALKSVLAGAALNKRQLFPSRKNVEGLSLKAGI